MRKYYRIISWIRILKKIGNFQLTNVLFNVSCKCFPSSNIKGGDQIIIRNMRKAKKIPGIKRESKYLGPMKVNDVTENHALDITWRQDKKIPLHIS